MRKRLLFLFFAMVVFQLEAQENTNLWIKNGPTEQNPIRVEKSDLIVRDYQIFQLDISSLRQTLSAIDNLSRNGAKNAVISIPFSNGHIRRFRVQKSNTLHPLLAQKYPFIQTFEGIGIEEPNAIVRFEITPKGFFGMVWSDKEGVQVIEPFANSSQSNAYLVYNKKTLHSAKEKKFYCQFDEIDHYRQVQYGTTGRNSDSKLRTFRLALACTGEYTQFHGGTKALALAAMATTLNRINGIFKREVAIELQLIPNNDLIIFTNGATDPYTNTDGSEMLGENQNTCDSLIGSANYDIGHVFSTDGGGVAYLGSVCFDPIKAGGVTGQQTPKGDPFDVDFVAHEIGHQFGATHTQNNDCNRTIASSYEPGSGSTIMGYAGICFPNIQNNSDAYFHAKSLEQIKGFITGNGNSCAVRTATNNAPPVVNAGADYFVPISTPFELMGTATDVDNDNLTYIWEQMDNDFAPMPPKSTSNVGPAFRSLPPSASSSRSFPAKGVNNTHSNNTWEILPAVERTMNFRFTVRDNFSGGGNSASDDMIVTFVADSGPFQITQPNDTTALSANTTHTITWDVAGTNLQPVNCENVDIFLSLDGGISYPVLLAQNAVNDGSREVDFPNDLTDNARIKIKCSDNVFFDVSDVNFRIKQASPSFRLEIDPESSNICQGNSIQYTIDVISVENFTAPVSLSAIVPPEITNFNFGQQMVVPGNTTTLTINTTNAVPKGFYEISIEGNSNGKVVTKSVSLDISDDAPPATTLLNPENNATGVAVSPAFNWQSMGLSALYQLQVASDENFSNIIYEATQLTLNAHILPFALEQSKTYYWRVKASNECGAGAFSNIFNFTISNVLCQQSTNDSGMVITSAGTPTITSPISISTTGKVKSIKVSINISHSWINDLTAKLISPKGTVVTIFDQICGNEDQIGLTFGNDGLAYASFPCSPNPVSNDTYLPLESFASFVGEDITGNWILEIKDHFNLDGGNLNSWSLEICKEVNADIPLEAIINSSQNPTCAGGENGSINAGILGGNPPYTISWNNGGNGLNLTNLGAGTYTLSVSDESGATASTSITLTQPLPISIEAITENVSCNGQATGSIQIFPSGGTPPYNYAWDNSRTQANIQNLTAGTYTVTVTDLNGCTASSNFTLTQPTPIALAFTTQSAVNGTEGNIDLETTGGTPPYQYTWSNDATTQDIDELAPGIFMVTVTDASGCTKEGQVELDNEITDQACYNLIINITLDNYGEETTWEIKDANGQIVAANGPYPNFQNGQVKTSNLCLPAGCYEFTIFDLWGDGICCSYGQGAYEVIEEATGKIIASGGSFNKEENMPFCLPTTDPSAPEVLTYCGANGRNTLYEWIEAIEIEGQVFNSGNNDGYKDFTDTPVEIALGDVLDLAFTPGFGFFEYQENWQVWIDFNRDGDFEDEGENVYLTSGSERTTGTIGIPLTATVGITRMRIAMKWGELVEPCESFSWGEVEDYALDLKPSLIAAEKGKIDQLEPVFKMGLPQLYTTQQRGEAYTLKIFPNPTTELIALEWEASKPKTYDLTIYNSFGQIELNTVLSSFKGSNKTQIDLASLPAGMYFLSIRHKDKMMTKDFIIAR